MSIVVMGGGRVGSSIVLPKGSHHGMADLGEG
jgi:hypothetical protein